MGNPYGEFVPDRLAPSGYRWRRHDEVDATQMLPIVQPVPVADVDPDRMPPEHAHAHGGDE